MLVSIVASSVSSILSISLPSSFAEFLISVSLISETASVLGFSGVFSGLLQADKQKSTSKTGKNFKIVHLPLSKLINPINMPSVLWY